jgi:hypothetical protein
MSAPTATLNSKEVETLIRRFSEFAQATSDVADEVSKAPAVFDYNRVAARFYEERILGLSRELDKYRAQVRTWGSHGTFDAGLLFTPSESAAISPALRARMNTPAEEAESIPEEL